MKRGKMLSMTLVTVFLSLLLISVGSADAQPLNVRVGDFNYNGTGTLVGSKLTMNSGNLTYKERLFNISNMTLDGMTFTLNGIQTGILDEGNIELWIKRTPPLIFNGSAFNGTTKDNRFKACVDRCIELEDDSVRFSYDKGWVTLTGAKDGTTSFFIFDKDGKREVYTVDSLGEGTVEIDLMSNITRLHNTSLHIKEKNIRVTGKNDTIIIDSKETIVKGIGDVEVKDSTNGKEGQQVTANLLEKTYIVVNSHKINVNGPFVMTVVRPEKGNDNVHLEGFSSLSKATVGRGEEAGKIEVENVQGNLHQTGVSEINDDDGKSEVALDWTVSNELLGAPTSEVDFVAADSGFMSHFTLDKPAINKLTNIYVSNTVTPTSASKIRSAIGKNIMRGVTGGIEGFNDLGRKPAGIRIGGNSFSYLTSRINVNLPDNKFTKFLSGNKVHFANAGGDDFSIKRKSGNILLTVHGKTKIAGIKYAVNVNPQNPSSLGLFVTKDWRGLGKGVVSFVAKLGPKSGVFAAILKW